MLARLHFDMLAQGTGTLDVFTDAGDFNQGLGYLYVGMAPVGTSITVGAVPEPRSVVLLAGGLALLTRGAGAQAGRCDEAAEGHRRRADSGANPDRE